MNKWEVVALIAGVLGLTALLWGFWLWGTWEIEKKFFFRSIFGFKKNRKSGEAGADQEEEREVKPPVLP